MHIDPPGYQGNQIEPADDGFQAAPALTLVREDPLPPTAATGFPAISAIVAAVDGLFFRQDIQDKA
jgi:hypothetical protein